MLVLALVSFEVSWQRQVLLTPEPAEHTHAITWLFLFFLQVHFQLKQDVVRKPPERKASGTRMNNKTLQKKVVPRATRWGPKDEDSSLG